MTDTVKERDFAAEDDNSLTRVEVARCMLVQKASLVSPKLVLRHATPCGKIGLGIISETDLDAKDQPESVDKAVSPPSLDLDPIEPSLTDSGKGAALSEHQRTLIRARDDLISAVTDQMNKNPFRVGKYAHQIRNVELRLETNGTVSNSALRPSQPLPLKSIDRREEISHLHAWLTKDPIHRLRQRKAVGIREKRYRNNPEETEETKLGYAAALLRQSLRDNVEREYDRVFDEETSRAERSQLDFGKAILEGMEGWNLDDSKSGVDFVIVDHSTIVCPEYQTAQCPEDDGGCWRNMPVTLFGEVGDGSYLGHDEERMVADESVGQCEVLNSKDVGIQPLNLGHGNGPEHQSPTTSPTVDHEISRGRKRSYVIEGRRSSEG